MKIDSLWLISFRNHQNYQLQFAEQTVIVGPNGSGKTSILEAIGILATTKSPITKSLQTCVNHDSAGFIISAKFSGKETLSISFKHERQKTIKINEEIISKTSELLGKVNTVLFLPHDIDIIQGSPVVRRKYLDIMISQIDPEYYKDLQAYYGILKQRNELLKNIRHGRSQQSELHPWDTQLFILNKRIMNTRKKYVAFMQETMSAIYMEMHQQKLTVQYESEARDTKLEDLFLRSYEADLRTGHTHIGIHTDDILFLVHDIPAVEYCSQGQQRMLSIALKCTEVKIKRDQLEDDPIVLIDDVLLELDIERFNKIITRLAPGSQQIFTVTDTSRFEKSILEAVTLIELSVSRGTPKE
jgi:DNA replication and repair protein RecF